MDLPVGSKIIIKQGASLIFDETLNKKVNTKKAKSTKWHFWKKKIYRKKGGSIVKYKLLEI